MIAKLFLLTRESR